MKVRLLVCPSYQGSRVSYQTCARRSVEQPGTACGPCTAGEAARNKKPLPESWPDGTPLRYAETRVLGTLLDLPDIPVRGGRR